MRICALILRVKGLNVLVYHSGCRKVPRSQSYQDVNNTTVDSQNTRLLLEEKEQALLASQETIQASFHLVPQ